MDWSKPSGLVSLGATDVLTISPCLEWKQVTRIVTDVNSLFWVSLVWKQATKIRTGESSRVWAITLMLRCFQASSTTRSESSLTLLWRLLKYKRSPTKLWRETFPRVSWPQSRRVVAALLSRRRPLTAIPPMKRKSYRSRHLLVLSQITSAVSSFGFQKMLTAVLVWLLPVSQQRLTCQPRAKIVVVFTGSLEKTNRKTLIARLR